MGGFLGFLWFLFWWFYDLRVLGGWHILVVFVFVFFVFGR